LALRHSLLGRGVETFTPWQACVRVMGGVEKGLPLMA